MSLTIKICKETIIIKNKAFSSLKVTYLSIREYPNLRHKCPLQTSKRTKEARNSQFAGYLKDEKRLIGII